MIRSTAVIASAVAVSAALVLAYAALGLLCFGPSKERNPVWERLVDETRQRLDKQLLHRSDYDNYWQAFNVAKAVCRFSLGLSKKDETSRLIERMVERIEQTSSNGSSTTPSPASADTSISTA